MKFAVVDVQGYSIPEFTAKELAIYDGNKMWSYVFKPTIPFHELSFNHQRHINYLSENHHGIRYGSGETRYEEIYSILHEALQDVDTIYVKGHVKEEFLIKIFTGIKHKIPNIVNLEFVSGIVPKLDIALTNCRYHSFSMCVCSVRNATILYNYIVSLLPQINHD